MALITITRAHQPTTEIRELITELDHTLGGMGYTPEQRHGLSTEAIFRPGIGFYVATVNGEAAGCAGIAVGTEFGEVKRMFVRPSHRGRGIATALLSRLTEAATTAGLATLKLETGIYQRPAISFYLREGFWPCAAFPPYTAMPPAATNTSLFFEKDILGATQPAIAKPLSRQAEFLAPPVSKTEQSSTELRFGRIAATLPVKNMNKALTFYINMLGFKKIFENGSPTSFAIIQRDNAELHLSLHRKYHAPSFPVAHLQAQNIETLFAICQAQSVHIVKELQIQDYGHKAFIFADPDGNRIDVSEPN